MGDGGGLHAFLRLWTCLSNYGDSVTFLVIMINGVGYSVFVCISESTIYFSFLLIYFFFLFLSVCV